ncbi:MAG TPA: LptF/LptG family permease [Desulfatiglandales bacterium]|nr:LptF/LptG family permease [Desulfatiglandales bacterium]
MRLTLIKYISREIYSFFLVGLLVFIFIVMATRMIWMTDLLVNQRVSLVQILKIILCLLPQAILFSMPAVCLMGVLLAFIRLSADNEIVALNAAGISLYQIMAPVILFSLTGYIITSLIAAYGVPWGNRSYRDVILGIMRSKMDVAIKERVFYEPFEDKIVFYVNSFSSKERTMKDLFVVDRRDQSFTATIVAKKGKIISNDGSDIVNIHFMDGTIFANEMDLNKARTIKFDTYDLNIDLGNVMSSLVSKERAPKEMYMGELIENFIKSRGKDSGYLIGIKLFEMFSIPLATFILGLIGAPLGAHVRGRGYTRGIILSLIVFLVYYISFMGVRYICETGILSPSIGAWIPVFFLFFICVYLLVQTTNYRSFGFLK